MGGRDGVEKSIFCLNSLKGVEGLFFVGRFSSRLEGCQENCV